jgi:hypothetical protein
MALQQLVIFFKQVLRQAQHERDINVLSELPFVLSPVEGQLLRVHHGLAFR